jgi:hypothetical protein
LKKIPLTKGFEALVDTQDYERFKGFRWHAKLMKNGTVYAQRGERSGDRVRSYFLHREILGAQPGQIVDHIDGDGLNNTRANLRICSASENGWNTAPRRGAKSSQYKGVCFSKKEQKYVVYIQKSGERLRIGCFVEEVAAAKAYDAAARILHGRFARCNFAEVV